MRILSVTTLLSVYLRDSIVVSISACHADDPGSIPGRGVKVFVLHILVWLLRLVLNFRGDLAQMVERSLSMREALGSMPRFSNFCQGVWL